MDLSLVYLSVNITCYLREEIDSYNFFLTILYYNVYIYIYIIIFLTFSDNL